jgi:hypothetical protein
MPFNTPTGFEGISNIEKPFSAGDLHMHTYHGYSLLRNSPVSNLYSAVIDCTLRNERWTADLEIITLLLGVRPSFAIFF